MLDTNSSQKQNIRKIGCINLEVPVTTICVAKKVFLIIGLGNGIVLKMNIRTNDIEVIGKHESPVCKVFWDHCNLVSFGCDQIMTIYTNEMKNQFSLNLPFITCAVGFENSYFLVGS